MSIPLPLDTDAEDVAWALQTADTLWKRNERVDAIVWLRRAAQAAGELEDDDRALALARNAAELSEWIAQNPGAPAAMQPGSLDNLYSPGSHSPESVAPIDDLLGGHNDVTSTYTSTLAQPATIEIPISVTELPEVATAAQVHAGILDPWSGRDDDDDDEPDTGVTAVSGAISVSSRSPARLSPLPDDEETGTMKRPNPGHHARFEPEEVVTSANEPRRFVPAPAPTLPAFPPPAPLPSSPSTMPEPTLVSALAPSIPVASPVPTAAAGLSLPPAPAAGLPPAMPPPRRAPPPVPTRAAGPPKPKPPLPAGARPPVPVRAAAGKPSLAPPEPAATGAAPSRSMPAPSAAPTPVAAAFPPVTPAGAADTSHLPIQVHWAPPQDAVAPAVESVTQETVLLDLADVEGLGDLPDDARTAFAAAAEIHHLRESDEASSFALALVVEGEVDVAATIVDAAAQRVGKGAVLRARGTVGDGLALRLICVGSSATVATWRQDEVDGAFKSCPWVEEDLRVAADRTQALVGITMGPLAERLDPSLRQDVTNRLVVRALAPGEILVEVKKTVPGLMLVGVGEIELVDGDTVSGRVGPGEFLFASAILGGGTAPSTARASSEGAVILFADRKVAQELLVTCPPLLELFAGM